MKLNFTELFNSYIFKFAITIMLLIVFVIFAVGLITYKYFTSSINDQIVRFNNSLLANLKKITDDEVFKKASFITLDLLFNSPNNEGVHFFLNNSLKENYSNIQPALLRINNIVYDDANIVDSIYIYYKNNNSIISSSYGLKFTDDKNIQTPYDTEWIDYFNKLRPENGCLWLKTRTVPISDFGGIRSNVITFIRTLPLNSNSANYQGLIAVTIKEPMLRKKILESSQERFENVFIVDSNGYIISHKNPVFLNINIKDKVYFSKILNSSNNNVILRVEGVNTVISSVKSDYSDWYYVYMVPVDEFYEQTNMVKQILIVIFSLALLLALFLASFLAQKLANPFVKIVNHSREILVSQNIAFNSQYNEFKVIENTIHALTGKVSNLEHFIIKNKPLITSTFYINLITNRIHSRAEIEKRLELINHKFLYPLFNIIIVQPSIGIIRNLDLKGVQYILYNLAEKIVTINLPLTPIILDGYSVVVLINYSEDSKVSAGGVICSLDDIVKNNYNIPMQYGIGMPCNDIMQIHKSFTQAQKAIRYSLIYPDMVSFWSELTSVWDANDTYDINKIYRIEEFIKELNYNRLVDLLQEIKINIISNHNSYDLYIRIINAIIHKFEETLNSMGLNMKDILEKPVSDYIDPNTNINDAFTFFEAIAKSIIEYIQNKSNNISKIYITRAKEYITHNLGTDISLESVAQELSISKEHLCRIFKEVSNENFIDYVTGLRMEKAKDILSNENILISTAAKMVGYNNSSYFIKQFKKYYGMTPNEYKKIVFMQT